MIRVDAIWLATEPVDMRAGADTLLACVVKVFGAARPRHAYLFANRYRDQATFSIPIEVCHNGVSMASIARPATSGGSP
jgi:transposase